MNNHRRATSWARLGLATLLLLGMQAGCWNGGHSETFVETGGRFALEIETGRSDLVGTHFLVDTLTGDLWRLDTRGGGVPFWVRVADGPADAESLEEIVARVPMHLQRENAEDED